MLSSKLLDFSVMDRKENAFASRLPLFMMTIESMPNRCVTARRAGAAQRIPPAHVPEAAPTLLKQTEWPASKRRTPPPRAQWSFATFCRNRKWPLACERNRSKRGEVGVRRDQPFRSRVREIHLDAGVRAGAFGADHYAFAETRVAHTLAELDGKRVVEVGVAA